MSRRLGGLLALAAAGCGGTMGPEDLGPADAGAGPPPPALYASEIIAFEPGEGGGYGQIDLPGVVLGAPTPGGAERGSLDVLSLGVGGSIVLGFGDRRIADGPDADFVVFENPFLSGGGAASVFAELGEVSVSTDAVSWHVFECDLQGDGAGRWPGCAGWNVVHGYDPQTLEPLELSQTGGDGFDLAAVGLSEAGYVRIRDLATEGEAPTAGFDLDAVGAIHLR